MENYDIVIIDSGVDANAINGICIEKKNEKIHFTRDISDKVGHGTIIYSIIKGQALTSSIFVIKLYESDIEFDSKVLIAALEYIKKNIRCKIINISLGIQGDYNISDLYNICHEISDRGTIIVSAFDNEGCYSYPAAFDCVIGVDNKNDLRNISEFDYVENSYINVFAKGSLQRVTLKNGNTILAGGSSVSCAYVTAFLANEISENKNLNTSLECLKKKSRFIYSSTKTADRHYLQNKRFKINTAVVFPFSKEAQSFVRFSDMVPFNIKGYYDVRQSGKVGRRLSSYYEHCGPDEIIKDIEKADFEDVDTIILGHLDELISISGHDYRMEIVDIAIKNKINIYSFDPLDKYYDEKIYTSGITFFCPKVVSDYVPQNTFGKLFKISRPVVSIFGTSSKQGKFSLQLALKRELEKRKYNVGTIGTEPHSLLFDFDVVFPMGYNSTVYLKNHEVVSYLNNEINNMFLLGKEIILTASQAQTIPFAYNNLLEIPSLQYHFAMGINPDAIILCVNYYDEIDYIQNTVYTLKGLTSAKVIAFVMYPMTYINDWSSLKRTITYEEYFEKSNMIRDYFGIPVYLLGDDSNKDLCQVIIDFF